MKTYITYGMGNKFNRELLPKVEDLDIRCTIMNKVPGTFWGSPVDAEYGWKNWCEDNDYDYTSLTKDNSFLWTLKPEAKILYIESLDDIEKKVPFVRLAIYVELEKTYIDFETIIKEYDAMELCSDNGAIGHMFVSDKELCFNSWDCDSIMVFNRDMIVPIE